MWILIGAVPVERASRIVWYSRHRMYLSSWDRDTLVMRSISPGNDVDCTATTAHKHNFSGCHFLNCFTNHFISVCACVKRSALQTTFMYTLLYIYFLFRMFVRVNTLIGFWWWILLPDLMSSIFDSLHSRFGTNENIRT